MRIAVAIPAAQAVTRSWHPAALAGKRGPTLAETLEGGCRIVAADVSHEQLPLLGPEEGAGGNGERIA